MVSTLKTTTAGPATPTLPPNPTPGRPRIGIGPDTDTDVLVLPLQWTCTRGEVPGDTSTMHMTECWTGGYEGMAFALCPEDDGTLSMHVFPPPLAPYLAHWHAPPSLGLLSVHGARYTKRELFGDDQARWPPAMLLDFAYAYACAAHYAEDPSSFLRLLWAAVQVKTRTG